MLQTKAWAKMVVLRAMLHYLTILDAMARNFAYSEFVIAVLDA